MDFTCPKRNVLFCSIRPAPQLPLRSKGEVFIYLFIINSPLQKYVEKKHKKYLMQPRA